MSYLTGIFPPLPPLLCIVCCDGDVANRSIKPDIEDFISETLQALAACFIVKLG